MLDKSRAPQRAPHAAVVERHFTKFLPGKDGFKISITRLLVQDCVLALLDLVSKAP